MSAVAVGAFRGGRKSEFRHLPVVSLTISVHLSRMTGAAFIYQRKLPLGRVDIGDAVLQVAVKTCCGSRIIVLQHFLSMNARGICGKFRRMAL